MTETHVPVVHEAHTHEVNTEEKKVAVDHITEKAVVKEIHEKPVVVETVQQTIVVNEGELAAGSKTVVGAGAGAGAGLAG